MLNILCTIDTPYALFSAPAAGSAGRVSLAQAPLALAPLLPGVLSLAASLSLASRGARDLPVEVDHSPLAELAGAAGAAAVLAPAAEEDLGAAARSPLRRSALWLLLPEVSLVVGALAEELAAGAAVVAEAGTKGSDSADNFRMLAKEALPPQDTELSALAAVSPSVLESVDSLLAFPRLGVPGSALRRVLAPVTLPLVLPSFSVLAGRLPSRLPSLFLRRLRPSVEASFSPLAAVAGLAAGALEASFAGVRFTSLAGVRTGRGSASAAEALDLSMAAQVEGVIF
mmetsp:Transcript_40572/g.70208  ORF Transcript_40572/g.70208 Transcript_40572/m.70208 type:complete len:285 (-) Transcript_40572:1860-2714(-)